MQKVCISLACAIAGSGLIASAHAADLAPPMSYGQVQPSEPVEWGTSWYLRGDIGWTAESQPQVNAALVYTGVRETRHTVSGDLGFGLNLNSWIRADLTYGARLPQTGLGGSRIRHTEILLNGYFDLGTWNGLTPYIGVGVGQANRVGIPVGLAGSLNERSFAFAAMLGVGWSLSNQVKLDIGYRYLNRGQGRGGIGNRNYDSHEARLGVRYMIE